MRKLGKLEKLLLGIPIALSLAAPAGAAVIEIDFDFTATTVSAVGGLINIPPDGAVTSGSATVRVPGNGTATISSGTGSISGFTLGISVNAFTLGVVVTGSVNAAQLGSAMGTLSASLMQLALTSPFLIQSAGNLDCTGAAAVCAFLGTFPVSFSGTQTLPPPFQLAIANVNTPGSAVVTGTTFVTIGGQSAILSLVGNEVSRTELPEPAPMLQLGAAGLALLFLARRRR